METVRKNGGVSFTCGRHSQRTGDPFLHFFMYMVSLLLLVPCLALTSCSTIDEDMSDCGFEVNYELKLVTSIQTKIQTQLETDLELQTNLQLTAALRTYLETIFRDYADDVDLSFYDVQGDSIRLEHDEHEMNGKEESYTLNIPRRHYHHLATANVKREQSVGDIETYRCHTARLVQMEQDTIPSHTTGLFSARYDMDIKDSVSQVFNVHLYMVNSATVLVVDTLGSHVRDITVYATGFASDFHVADSAYTFAAKPPIVLANPVNAGDKQYACYATVNLPSRDQLPTSGAPRRADDSVAAGIWEYHIYTTNSKGKVTRNVLHSYRPLNAEQVLVVHVKLDSEGVIGSTDATVGVSVTLDWNNGGTYEPQI